MSAIRMRALAGPLLALFSILLALAGLEIGLRVVQPPRPARPQPQVEYEYVPRDVAAGRLASYWRLVPRKEGYHLNVPVRSNSLGIRNAEIPVEPHDRYRIVVLGDSHTFGFGVIEEQTWPRLLERSLRDRTGDRQVEVINAGIEGLAIEQEIQFFQDCFVTLKPNLVILTYYWNDMPMIGSPEEPWPDGVDMIPPTMSSEKSAVAGKAAARGTISVAERIKGLLKQSYLLYNVVQHAPALQTRMYPSIETKWKRATLEGVHSPRLNASWAFVESQLVGLKKLSIAHSFDLTVVVVPLFEQMTSSSYPDAAYQSELLRIGRSRGIDIVDPLPAIKAVNPRYPRHFIPFDGHPNGLIYQVVANAAGAHLSSRIGRTIAARASDAPMPAR